MPKPAPGDRHHIDGEDVRVKLLPSTFENDGSASRRQHYACFIVDGCVAFDAGSLANAVTPVERENIRDVVLTHAHLDHIAGLPLFIDDLFATLTKPVRIHGTRAVIKVLEDHIFNWSVYPRFSELTNWFGKVVEYQEHEYDVDFQVRHLTVRPVAVNHKVPSSGFIISDGNATIAMTGDTAETDRFWTVVNETENVSAILIECAFPDDFAELAAVSHHLTPSKMAFEIGKLKRQDCPIYAVNLKPMYRDAIVSQLDLLRIPFLEVFEVGREYWF